jgi:hypothetical protein
MARQGFFVCALAYTLLCLSPGGLTENDFIMAAKINQLDFTDLQPQKKHKFWA